MLTKADIQQVWIEMTGACNLSCPLCIRELPTLKQYATQHIRPAADIIKQLEEFPNLSVVKLAGVFSEPTLHPGLPQILEYVESRKMTVHLLANGNTKSESWWAWLGETFKTISVRFTVCGSTQELHEKYRGGSDLEQVYASAAALRSSGNKNDFLHVLRFEYNAADIEQNLDKIVRDFSDYGVYNSLPYHERFGPPTGDIRMTPDKSVHYISASKIGKMRHKAGTSNISCSSFNTRYVYINQYGKIFPCYMYMVHGQPEFNLDYTDIHRFKHEFCYECDAHTRSMLLSVNIDPLT